MSDSSDRIREIPLDTYDELLEHVSQVHAEGWIPVLRHDTEPVEARPVERQSDRNEGERIESDQWLIRDANGETYTVSSDTFEDRYEMENEYRTERFLIDLSWGTIDYDIPDDAPDIDIDGWTIVAEVVAHIHVPTQAIERLLIERCDIAQTEHWDADGIPVEVFNDSPMVSAVESDE